MKKHVMILAAVAALFTLSCSREPVDVQTDPEGETGEITYLEAGFDGLDETRTVRQSDGKVFWSPGDEIAIIRGTSSAGRKKFTATNTEPAARATFSGTMPSGSAAYWAVYPYSADAFFNGTYLVTTLPDKQEAVAGSFADDLFVSAAYVRNSTTSITFVHQCGGVKFSLTEPGVKKVTLIPAAGDVYLAGLIGLYAASTSSKPYIRATGYPEDMSSTIELSAPEGKTLEVGAAYHFVTIPANLTGGFTLLFEKENGQTGMRTVTKDVSIQAGHFATLMDADKGVEYKDPYLDFSPSEIMVDELGGLFSLDVTGTMEYHIDSYSDWIKEVPTSGDARLGRRHAFVAGANTEGSERTGMLSVCYGDNCYPVMVTQSAGAGLAVIPHHTFGMRFTATWCQYCPIMDATFHLAKDRMGDAFEYVCIYDTSGNYGFAGAATLNTAYFISGFPSAIIDGRYELGNYDSEDAYALLADEASKTVSYYPTATSIGIESSLSGRTLSVKVDVKAQYEEDYKLTVFLCENDIIGNQTHYQQGTITNFNHSRVARMSLTGYMGDQFEGPDAGGVKSFSYTATIPSGYNVDNMEVVAFVQRNFNDRPAIQSGAYGDWYVDNSRSAALGTKVDVEF